MEKARSTNLTKKVVSLVSSFEKSIAKLQSALQEVSWSSGSESEVVKIAKISLWKSPASMSMDFNILSERRRLTKHVQAANLTSLSVDFNPANSSSYIFLLSNSFFLQLSSSLVREAKVLNMLVCNKC